MGKKVDFTIKATMDERWVNDFCSMLNWMQSCGNLGHSSVVAFYSDGDGDFRPEFKTDMNWEKQYSHTTEKAPELYFDAG